MLAVQLLSVCSAVLLGCCGKTLLQFRIVGGVLVVLVAFCVRKQCEFVLSFLPGSLQLWSFALFSIVCLMWNRRMVVNTCTFIGIILSQMFLSYLTFSAFSGSVHNFLPRSLNAMGFASYFMIFVFNWRSHSSLGIISSMGLCFLALLFAYN